MPTVIETPPSIIEMLKPTDNHKHDLLNYYVSIYWGWYRDLIVHNVTINLYMYINIYVFNKIILRQYIKEWYSHWIIAQR